MIFSDDKNDFTINLQKHFNTGMSNFTQFQKNFEKEKKFKIRIYLGLFF